MFFKSLVFIFLLSHGIVFSAETELTYHCFDHHDIDQRLISITQLNTPLYQRPSGEILYKQEITLFHTTEPEILTGLGVMNEKQLEVWSDDGGLRIHAKKADMNPKFNRMVVGSKLYEVFCLIESDRVSRPELIE